MYNSTPLGMRRLGAYKSNLKVNHPDSDVFWERNLVYSIITSACVARELTCTFAYTPYEVLLFSTSHLTTI